MMLCMASTKYISRWAEWELKKTQLQEVSSANGYIYLKQKVFYTLVKCSIREFWFSQSGTTKCSKFTEIIEIIIKRQEEKLKQKHA